MKFFNSNPKSLPIKHFQEEDRAKQRVQILNSSFDPVTIQETVNWAIRFIQEEKRGYICTVNVAILMMMENNKRLAKIINKAVLIVADGQPIIWTSRWLSAPLPSRVAGIDLIYELAAVAEQRQLGIYLLGGTTDVIADAAAKLQSKHPRLKISFDNGYFSSQQAAGRAEAIRQSGASILFVGMGVPRQEYFLEEHWENLGVNLAIGVGGSFDVIAGRKKRAPLWVQEVGLEWLYRLLQEPRRLWRRYLFTNLQFIYTLLQAFIHKSQKKQAA
ncbi:WecB/TagA/CpsF family glycosyltransferase [Tolypothrix bouteillei VB521301]|uniref:WecB/TagA/CpsF family glycosyltransferase n=3 Tax=Nostocales TaxID=1161 RepID=A0A8S9SXE9_9CYAN|nr:WecB/TagA/CpsF family glycosyltransferase [Tolypothrix bouteillei VB521301]